MLREVGARHRGRRGEPRTLAGRASNALAWGVGNALAGRLGTLVIGIALARILGPEQFGTYAVALLALMAALSFNELGVSLAIVRWRGSPNIIAPTVATLSVVASLAIAVTGMLLAPTLSRALGDESATGVLQVLCATVVVSGLVATPAALLQRDFRQRTRTLIDQVAIWVGAVVSIALAVAGLGAMSLAVGRLFGVVASCAMMLRAVPEGFRLGWNPSQVRPLLRFGLPLAGASILVFAVGFIDQLVATRTMGATALAFYVLAANLASWPLTVFSAPLRSVAPAAFARLQHDPHLMGETFVRVAGLLSAAALPVCLGLGGASASLVLLVYGEDWAGAAQPLVWLGAGVACRLFFELAYDYLVVAGGTRRLFGLQVVWLSALIPALLFGSRWGLAGIAAAQVVVAVALVTPMHLLLLRHRGVPIVMLARRVWCPVLISMAYGAFAWWLSGSVRSPVLAVSLTMLVGLVVVAGLLWANRSVIRELQSTPSDGLVQDPVPHS